ncbi:MULTISPECIES: hypothetical protein [unclassified Paenibacillus]|uniref:hypothetical protein n=1 Tax=unclassified Paenibacillus TaxID=185978 RepID=UPI00020D6C0E|nr:MULTISPECIES: hypothetical protein [unclassified Paenibacillus]EGL15945.1 hypothetical protein HMPREF9413_3484 [Paenibacillus sp. HGF7]EPD83684.1 hypothetical protein HMPREF1207_03047 [Paenibacillus sp. HGH0039]
MFTRTYPNFAKGRILKTEMLENLRDFPHELTDLFLRDYSDGIVAGTEIRVGEDSLCIGPGIVKHGGLIYTLTREVELPYAATGRETVVKIRFYPAETEGDFTVCRAEPLLDEQVSVSPGELELARFKLKEGARLRSDYRNFADLATEYNTLNRIRAQYAGFRQSTLHPEITRHFAAEMLKSRAAGTQDFAFAMQCLSMQSVDREAILHYLAVRLGREYKPYTNEQIHAHLSRILEEAGNGSRPVPGGRFGAPQRMIVD